MDLEDSILTVNIEDDFIHIYNNGRVVSEEQYHQPDKIGCSCSKTTSKGAYRDVIVHYQGSRYYFYHQTPVVIELADGKVVINNGGYTTKSTRQRINDHTSERITIDQRDDQWYLQVDGEEEEFNRSALIKPSEG